MSYRSVIIVDHASSDMPSFMEMLKAEFVVRRVADSTEHLYEVLKHRTIKRGTILTEDEFIEALHEVVISSPSGVWDEREDTSS